MIAEGDSWFEHPLIPDLLDWAGRDYAALSLAKAGDTWSDILDEDSNPPKRYSDGTLMGLLHTVDEEDKSHRPPGTVLLSAGGNDLIGQISRCVHDYDPKRPEDEYIDHAQFDPILDLILQDYRTKTKELGARGKRIIMHSYDYPNPIDNGPYIGLPLRRDKNIPGVGLMRQIVNQMIDLFAEGLMEIAATSNNVGYFVNLRGTIGTKDYLNGPDQLLWSDEMHGSRLGFERLWDVLDVGIQQYAR